ncbi:MAG: molecular chaperone Tir [SAR324 cluster bacterium]|nr:molecular chaperone Tir [SAR324 cluster bacterium]MBL7034633.1 molecular chaperone Tir [SAR324 cluster bacterium]
MSTISCTTKNSKTTSGTLYFRETIDDKGWHAESNSERDGIYEGEIKRGKPFGQGTYIYYSGSKKTVFLISAMIPGLSESVIFAIIIWQLLHQRKQAGLYIKYEGNWKYGKKHGKGKYFFLNGDRYEGNWKYGKKQGEGTYFFSNEDKYVGSWKQGKKDGQGTYYFSDGDKYEGTWRAGKAHGTGTYTYPDGEKYIGEWKEGLKHSQGNLIFSN